MCLLAYKRERQVVMPTQEAKVTQQGKAEIIYHVVAPGKIQIPKYLHPMQTYTT
jgi:hypothetical protein